MLVNHQILVFNPKLYLAPLFKNFQSLKEGLEILDKIFVYLIFF